MIELVYTLLLSYSSCINNHIFTYSSRVAQRVYFIVQNDNHLFDFFFNFSVNDWDLDVKECYLD